MRKATVVALGVLVGALTGIRSEPATAIVLDFDPGVSLSVTTGESIDVDVFVSGLEAGGQNQIVSAFDLDIDYDESVLNPTGVTFGTDLGDPSLLEALTDFDLTGGTVNLAEVSLLNELDLQARQGDVVTLATLSFAALGTGITSFGVLFGPGQDIKGLNAAPLSVTVVPVPAALPLFASGLVALVLVRRKRSRSAAPEQLSGQLSE